MIVRQLEELTGTQAEVKAADGAWVSRRFLRRADGVGFSFHDTLIRAGTETFIHYAHHVEAVYCVSGDGELEDLETGVVYPLRDGTLYALNGHERHRLRGGREDMRMVCVFTPPLVGDEVHGVDGTYPPARDDR